MTDKPQPQRRWIGAFLIGVILGACANAMSDDAQPEQPLFRDGWLEIPGPQGTWHFRVDAISVVHDLGPEAAETLGTKTELYAGARSFHSPEWTFEDIKQAIDEANE